MPGPQVRKRIPKSPKPASTTDMTLCTELLPTSLLSLHLLESINIKWGTFRRDTDCSGHHLFLQLLQFYLDINVIYRLRLFTFLLYNILGFFLLKSLQLCTIATYDITLSPSELQALWVKEMLLLLRFVPEPSIGAKYKCPINFDDIHDQMLESCLVRQLCSKVYQQSSNGMLKFSLHSYPTSVTICDREAMIIYSLQGWSQQWNHSLQPAELMETRPHCCELLRDVGLWFCSLLSFLSWSTGF